MLSIKMKLWSVKAFKLSISCQLFSDSLLHRRAPSALRPLDFNQLIYLKRKIRKRSLDIFYVIAIHSSISKSKRKKNCESFSYQFITGHNLATNTNGKKRRRRGCARKKQNCTTTQERCFDLVICWKHAKIGQISCKRICLLKHRLADLFSSTAYIYMSICICFSFRTSECDA